MSFFFDTFACYFAYMCACDKKICFAKVFLLLNLCFLPSLLYAQGNKLDAPITYQASDSIVMYSNGTAYLFGKGDIRYTQMQLQSDYIRVQMDSNLIYAKGVLDTITNEVVGKPVFQDGGDSYQSDEMTYNLQTQKGFIRHVVTEQGEGYIIADRTKKMQGNTMMMAGGMYTTCDQHDHPHFYLQMTKAKVKPGEYIATGPAYLVVGDVPLPLAIPFGFFPFTDKYSSGLIMPSFGDDRTRGLYLNGLGYYFAINDYLDLEVKGDIYSRGTWAIYATTRYVKRYAFSGNINLSYRNDVIGEKGMPGYSKNPNFSIQWTHNQDAKANPYCNFSAQVNFSTSGYNRSNINSYYNPSLYSENTKSSSINYTQRFPNSPWSISLTASVNQQTRDSTLSLTLPNLSVNMTTVYPFKRKKQIGKEKWYEKISLSYSGEGRIAVSRIKENDFLHSNFLRDWQVGMRHNIPIRASFMLFKYLSVTPSVNLTDRMYFQRVDQTWNDALQQVVNDTTTGFYNVFDFNANVSISTKLYGFYTPSKKLFPNSKVDRFRHVLTPQVSFSYHPDFGSSTWGYYGAYDQPVLTSQRGEDGLLLPQLDEQGNPLFVHQVYSRFPNAIYQNAARGATAMLSFSLQNNLEMKVINKNDTTGKNPYRVVSLIDNFSISGAYNFIADSMNWSNFNVNLRIKLPKLNNYTLNLSGSFDPYMYELNALGNPVRTNKQYWNNKRCPHFLGTQFGISYTFNNQTFKKWFDKGKKNKKQEDEQPIEDYTINQDGTGKNGKLPASHTNSNNDDGYIHTDFPWSFTINYSLNYISGPDFDYKKMYYKMIFTHNLSMSASLGLGAGWKVTASTSYDFHFKRFTTATFNVSRDLHCWNMSASFVPFGPNASYTFHIGVNASMLSDLKYDKSSYNSTNKRVDWW